MRGGSLLSFFLYRVSRVGFFFTVSTTHLIVNSADLGGNVKVSLLN